MHARLDWQHGICLRATSGSAHTVTIDGAEAHGGQNLGIRPMELMIVSLASCSALDVVLGLNKKKGRLKALSVSVEGKRRDEIPQIFTDIDLHFQIAIHPEHRDKSTPTLISRTVAASVEKYCSAVAMLRPDIAVRHRWSAIE